MISLERTRDYELVRQIMTHPAIFRHISDDGSPRREEYRPWEGEAAWYLLVKDNEEVLGLFMVHPHNSVTWEVHTCLLPSAWGERAKEAAHKSLQFIWKEMPCQRLITNVPRFNRLALRFAQQAGLKVFGVNHKSFLKHGQLHDQIMLGISKEEQCQQ